MGRSRNIKPGFFTNEDLAECSLAARLLYIGLWTLADREGRLEDRPKKIKAEVFPFDAVNSDTLLNELTIKGFIVRYEVSGNRYIQILKFRKHQSPHHKEVESVIPPPQRTCASMTQACSKHEPSMAQACVNVDSSMTPLGPLIPDSLNLIPDSVAAEPRSRFVPPSVPEVAAYCSERGNAVDPEKFVDHYSAKGWMIGKNKMKDWRAAVRTWEPPKPKSKCPDFADLLKPGAIQ